jgi:tetratricopeptide (TPR) repeat protein
MADGDLTFGARLASCRRLAGLSQEALAKRAGLSVRAISNLERGRARWPHPDSLRRLADALRLRGRARAEFFAAAARQLPDGTTTDTVTMAGGRSGEDGPVAGAGTGTPLVPRQLPAAVGCFVGRAAELAALTDLLEASHGAGTPAVVISAVGGMAGVGKTALAVQWAHRVAGRFPDGQLYVDLRGFDRGVPVAAGDALAGFLRALGVAERLVPDGTADRARLFRSRLAGRRVLVLLDNARDGDQVRPLLPGDGGCVAVVTSRDALAGLVATDGARRLDLDVLPVGDAVALLGSLVGGRAGADPVAAAGLAGLCARLPLALRIAAEMAAARPLVPLAELAAELEAGRLDFLDAGEDRAAVRAVFSWSLRQLPRDAARAFALLGLHPGQDVDTAAAAALTGATAVQAGQLLGRLRRASLVHVTGPGRYGMHDLLRAYAGELAAARGPGCCRRALTRLFDYYLAAAGAAMDALLPAEAGQRPAVPRPGPGVVPVMAGAAGARGWLDRERANLAAVAAYCAWNGWPAHATDLVAVVHRYLMRGSHLAEGQAMYQHALHAARLSGDRTAEAQARNGLGAICYMKGRFGQAAAHYQAALGLYQPGWPGRARVLCNLAQIEQQLRNDRSAARYYRQAITAFTAAADSWGATLALAGLAEAETELGRYAEAGRHLRRVLPAARAAGDHDVEATALEATGVLSLRRGQLTQAARYFTQALALFRRLDFPTEVAAQLFNLAEVSLRQGDHGQAETRLREALAMFRQAGYHYGEIRTLRTLAQALHQAGQPAAARAKLTEALRLATQTGNTYQQAAAHHDLADSHHHAGHPRQARHHWQHALTLYTTTSAPEADQIRTQLAAQQAF